jgi:hypothetical protein
MKLEQFTGTTLNEWNLVVIGFNMILSFQISAQFMELYNEEILDLFDSSTSKGTTIFLSLLEFQSSGNVNYGQFNITSVLAFAFY